MISVSDYRKLDLNEQKTKRIYRFTSLKTAEVGRKGSSIKDPAHYSSVLFDHPLVCQNYFGLLFLILVQWLQKLKVTHLCTT